MKGRSWGSIWLLLCGAVFALVCAGHFFARNVTDEPYLIQVSQPFQVEDVEKQPEEETGTIKALLPGERIDLNHAPLKDLMRLPQIGQKRAEAIVAWREENGGFQSLEELKEVYGIGEGIFAQVEKYITIGEAR